ncbi:MAG: 3-hydroxyacyl-CoA dehydrogenase/enoyl-CoA hydratase family protein [Saprospirales bacterium]|nr:3-hydroxyacyl-CoA dehydrogenase/enoyl-CoA hydratase family protein [Saprospirales bacterium]
MKKIKTVGVVGAGTMGSALAQKFAQEGFTVILADREMKFIEKGLALIRKFFDEAVEKNVLPKEKTDAFFNNIRGTTNSTDLAICDLVVEAIFEDFQAKTGLLETLSGIVSRDAVIATNTSSFSVTELSEHVSFPERFVGLHFFYHAAKNRLVEIIPGEKTSAETLATAKFFAMQAGKDAIVCADAYGFVVNRFFVPWLNEAVKILEEGHAGKEEIDAVCMNLFGIGMGPFALMNATGIPVAYHAQKTLEVFGEPYAVSAKLKQQAETQRLWELGAVSAAQVDPGAEKMIRERMLGIIFFIAAQILDEKICTPAAINRGARIGLKWRKGPVDMMKEMGEPEVKRLIEKAVTAVYGVKMPRSVGPDFWKTEFVLLEIKHGTALITINRPEDLNALNETVIAQLDEQFGLAEKHPAVRNIVITGSGKAFVAGADIRFFVKNMQNSAQENIVAFTQYAQRVFQHIDASPKKVVVLLNGLAFGGGLELALCGDVILALPSAKIAFPETGIGIYPALGGTFRTTRRVGKGLTKYLVCTGALLGAPEAEKIGLVDQVIRMDEMFDLLSGAVSPETYTSEKRQTANSKYQLIEQLFDQFPVDKLRTETVNPPTVPVEISTEIQIKLRQKAPVALQISERLIDANSGDKEVLSEVATIFSTADAYLGLTSIGKSVQYQGK